ncbi:MAG: methyl-accepting chemotaxis protein, partial [Spirochaetia bacterium]
HAEELVPELTPILAAIEEPHNQLHQSAVHIDHSYEAVDEELGNTLRERKAEHLLWAGNIKTIILTGDVSSAEVETNAELCALGIWLNADSVQNLINSYSEFETLYNQLLGPHEQLHESAIDILALVRQGSMQTAFRRYEAQTEPLLENVLSIIDNMLAWHNQRTTGIREAERIYAQETSPALTEVQTLLTQFKNTVAQNIMTDQVMLQQAAQTRVVIIIVSFAAVLAGAALAFIITRAIVSPIRKSIAFTSRIAAGDLTAEIDIQQKDEVGQLAMSMRQMVSSLTGILESVKHASNNVASGSQSMSSTSQQMSQGATEQAASAEEVSSSMEEMASNIRQNADNAMETDKIAKTAVQNAEKSGSSVHETVEAMKNIADRISIIEEIARQTNMLALNAAIEAARAGEQGKGFAVVASEVKKLSERSQKAAGEISELTNSSVAIAEEAGVLLDKMVPNIQRTAELVQEISAASNEQNSGAEQINKAIVQLDQVIQQNASASEEMASMAEELSGQCDNLRESVEYFKLKENTVRQIEEPKAQRAHSFTQSQTVKTTKASKKEPAEEQQKPKQLEPVLVNDDNYEEY